jgi:hypothetical protein
MYCIHLQGRKYVKQGTSKKQAASLMPQHIFDLQDGGSTLLVCYMQTSLTSTGLRNFHQTAQCFIFKKSLLTTVHPILSSVSVKIYKTDKG